MEPVAGTGVVTWGLWSGVARADQSSRRTNVAAQPVTEVTALHPEASMSDEIAKAKIRRALLSGPERIDAAAAGLPTVMRDAGTMVMFAGSPYAHLHICGSPWEGNEYHPGDRAVWTMKYTRP